MAQTLLSTLAALGPFLVGGVMLFAALAKILDPKNFVGYLNDLNLIPWRWRSSATLMIPALQMGLGMALWLGLWPHWVLPATTLLLVLLAGVGYWSTATGRTRDCGCYNGLLTVTRFQSLVLDSIYIAALVFSWQRYVETEVGQPRWKLAVVLASAAFGSVLTSVSFSYEKKHGRPLYDLSPLRAGRNWDPAWLEESLLAMAEGKNIIAFMNAECPHCKRWIKVLNAVHVISDLPDVTGAVVLSQEKLASYLEENGIRFPVVAVKPWVVARLARGFTPTAVVVENGLILEKWVGRMPKSFADQIRAATAARGSSDRPPLQRGSDPSVLEETG